MYLLFLLNVPLGDSTPYDNGAIVSPMVPCSLLSGTLTNLQKVLVTDFEPCDTNQKYPFLSVSAAPPYQPEASYLSRGFRASLEIGTFVLSFLFIMSSAGKYLLERGVDLYTKNARYGSEVRCLCGQVWNDSL